MLVLAAVLAMAFYAVLATVLAAVLAAELAAELVAVFVVWCSTWCPMQRSRPELAAGSFGAPPPPSYPVRSPGPPGSACGPCTSPPQPHTWMSCPR